MCRSGCKAGRVVTRLAMKDMRVLLTGATGGIGAALAVELAEAGAYVLLHGRNSERLGDIARRCAGRAQTVQGDLNCATDRERMLCLAKAERCNVLLNNAGVNEFSIYEQTDVERVITTNVTSPMLLTQSMLTYLTGLPAAMIVNVGSTFGAIGYPGYVAYCASKHAIKGFSEALKRELSDSRVEVIYVSPRATATEMNAGAANDANVALGVAQDSAERVAEVIMAAMQRSQSRVQLGAVERAQVKMNALFPSVVDKAIGKQLKTIKHYANHEEGSL